MRDPLRNISVRYKLALTFVGVCLLAFGVGGFLVSSSAKDALEGAILERLALQARAYAHSLDDELRALGQRSRDFASDGYIRARFEELLSVEDPAQRERAEEELREHLVVNKLPIVPAYLDLAVVGAEGGTTLLAGRTAGSWFEQAAGRAERGETWTSGFLAAHGVVEYPTVLMSTPLYSLSGGRRLGDLAIRVHPGVWISEALGGRRAERAGAETEPALRLIDPSGRWIDVPPHLARRDTAAAPGEVVLSGLGLALQGPRHGSPPGAPARGVLSRSTSLSTSGWTAQVELESYEALQAVAGLQTRLLFVGLALAATASLLLFFPVRFLARPLIALTEAASRIRDGELGVSVEVDSADEVGELSRSFNSMAAALEERSSRLRTERDRLDAVIRSMRDGLVVLSADGEPVEWNAAARPLLGLMRSGTVRPSRHRVCADGGVNGARENGAGENGGVERTSCAHCLFEPGAPPRSCLVDVGASTYEVRSSLLPPDESGRRGRVFVSRDVTDHVTQDEREIHQERLAVLGEVAAAVAHELNNPLASITMFNQMMAAELAEDSPLRENVEVIERNAQACGRTIRDLLDYATGSTPEVDSVDVHATLEDVTRFLRPLRRRGADVALELGAEDPVVRGDEVQIRQVFVNLILNAQQAAEGDDRGRTRVRVGTSLHSEHLLVEISDDGPGIPPELVQQIFRPFFTTKPRGEGTGLGLSTARRIAELQGGGLELVESRPGRTVFLVRLLREGA